MIFPTDFVSCTDAVLHSISSNTIDIVVMCVYVCLYVRISICMCHEIYGACRNRFTGWEEGKEEEEYVKIEMGGKGIGETLIFYLFNVAYLKILIRMGAS